MFRRHSVQRFMLGVVLVGGAGDLRLLAGVGISERFIFFTAEMV